MSNTLMVIQLLVRYFKLVLPCILAFLVCCCGLLAQTVSQIGFPPHAEFTGSEFDSVQLNNGNLHIEIPIWSTQGRGLGYGYKFVYDSKGFFLEETCLKSGECFYKMKTQLGNHLTLRLVSNSPVLAVSQTIRTEICNGPGYLTHTYTGQEADGTRHTLLPSPAAVFGPTCWGPLGTLYDAEGSGWQVKVDSSGGNILQSTRKDGVVTASGTATDSNGNQLTTADTLGRPISADGSYYDSSGVLRNLSITYQSINVQTDFCINQANCTDYTSTWSVPQVITLPNGLSYTFTYDIQGGPTHPYYGEPLSVALPTGGQITWTWSATGGENGRQLLQRMVSGDPEPWIYSLPWGGQGIVGNTFTGKVTDPAGNDTAITYTYYKPGFNDLIYGGTTLGSPYITKKQFYQGPSTGQPLKTVDTVYDTTNTILPIRETTTWNPQNLVSKVETDWDSFAVWSGAITWRNPVERREYGFGTGGPGSLIRTTSYGYQHLTNSTYRGLNIADRLTSTKVYAGSSQTGTLTAQSLNTYDGVAIPTTGDTSASPAPNHDYANFPRTYNLRGNLTQSSKGLKSGATWTWLNTNNTYNDLGQILTSTDPGNHQTTYDYTGQLGEYHQPSVCHLDRQVRLRRHSVERLWDNTSNAQPRRSESEAQPHDYVRRYRSHVLVTRRNGGGARPSNRS